ncbi:conjugal transfer protein TraD [Legionella genomosp. 1]|uniref:conjugal transfer protein TraD n=1 Tax=Legionella genomosp. 1 TaxID=1093625 RepID=UPI001054A436|nr:conjugal transfer protein TraD [Legionella genomosp. 1]
MDITKQIIRQKQVICRDQKLLTVEKLRKRRADTKRKIELGGLIIKSGLDSFNKAILLGAFDYLHQAITDSPEQRELFQQQGELIFMKG